MKNLTMKHLSRAALMAGVATIALLAGGPSSPAQAIPVLSCPAFGADTDCGIKITINPGGSLTIAATGQGPYDTGAGTEDTLVGVFNNSGGTIASIHLASTLDIGGFDGDGIDTFGAVKDALNTDTTGYGGPLTFFTNNLGTSLDANFNGGLADQAQTFCHVKQGHQ